MFNFLWRFWPSVFSWPKKWWWRSQVPCWLGGSSWDSIILCWIKHQTICTGTVFNLPLKAFLTINQPVLLFDICIYHKPCASFLFRTPASYPYFYAFSNLLAALKNNHQPLKFGIMQEDIYILFLCHFQITNLVIFWCRF